MPNLNWTRHMAEYVRNPQFPNYGASADPRPVLVDCSLGVNPLKLYPDAEPVKMYASQYAEYPGGHNVQALGEYVQSRFPTVNPEDLCFGAGSEGVLSSLGRTLGGSGVLVKAFKPTFLPALVEFASAGARVETLELDAPFKIDIDRMIAALDSGTTLVYIDNPNNPTGQVLPLSELDRLAQACRERGILLLVDEAYADFVDDANSAFGLTYDNVICTRSFSKGCGLAGARVGYLLIRDRELLRHYQEVGALFTCSKAASDLAERVLPSLSLAHMRQGVKALKKAVLEFLSGYPQFTMGATSEDTSILFLVWEKEDGDLYDELMDAGIMTESGVYFALTGGGRNCVRLRVPPQEQLEQFKELWQRKFGPGA
ncbi:MAG: aminotransferase class I/II-fold pyridoxal phosphate-dependent enzyme [Candidatus Adiutrix sp.]|jgi:histidinol-phosphate aminotransferase|nr:aminotransferase class I/II-fold pyridoxal phosphate-dependent enzyme [Candidatus Adiutrix sp.]